MRRYFIPALVLITSLSFAQTAEEIVSKADAAMKYDSAYMKSRMVNSDQFGTKTVSFIAWAKGTDFLMEFTNDADYGQKVLRTDDRIYHFFPDSETIFTKSKGDNIVGLISYEDITDESSMLANYEVSLLGEENIRGFASYKVQLRVKKGKRVAYPNQIVWIDKNTFTLWRSEMYTRSGKALKTMEIREVKNINGKQIATDILVRDEVRKEVSSEIFIDEAKLNIPIDAGKFTRKELTR